MNDRPILIQVAMEIECQEIIKYIENLEKIEMYNYTFYKGTINNNRIIISLSKVGLIHASSSLTIAIREFEPRIIINTGIAGATDKKLHIGDIIIADTIININSYKTANLKEGEGSNPNNWELLTFLSGEVDKLVKEKANTTLIEVAKSITNNEYGKIYIGSIGSGDVWNREIDRILYLNKNYNILCEDMESIATYTIANSLKIPVISIKMISDNTLTGEEYNREIGEKLEKYIMEYIQNVIKNNS